MSHPGGVSGPHTVFSFGNNGENGENLLFLSSSSAEEKNVYRPSPVNLSFLPEGTFVVSSPLQGMFVSSTGVVYEKKKERSLPARLVLGRKKSVRVASVSHNFATTLFLVQNRKGVFAIGDNASGQVVPAHPSEEATLQEINLGLPHGTTVLEIAVGAYHIGLALSNGQLAMWGRACYLGTGSKIVKPHLKIAFVSLPRGRAVSLEMGSMHTVVLFKGLDQQGEGGSISSFGRGREGQLGLGDRYSRHSSIEIESPTGLCGFVKAVACGYRHTVCLTLEGQAYAFGDNFSGECGVNSSVKKILSPTLIVPPSPDLKFVKISCGNSQNLALVVGSEGGLKVVSWGASGAQGRLGLGGTGNKWKPEVIEGLDQLDGIAGTAQIELFANEDSSTVIFLPSTSSPRAVPVTYPIAESPLTATYLDRQRSSAHWHACVAHNSIKMKKKTIQKVVRPTTITVEVIDSDEEDEVEYVSLGIGGFGEVFLAKWDDRNAALVENVAFKVIGPLVERADIDKVVRDEVEKVRNLAHPLILITFGYVKIRTRTIGIVQELMKCSLLNAIHGPLDGCLRVQLHYALQMVNALKHLHLNRQIHCDIKPANFLLSHDGCTIKLTDFGLVKGLDSSLSAGRSHASAAGTVRYMAKELYGRNPDYSEKSDTFALGMCFFELFCGHIAFPQVVNSHVLATLVQDGALPDVPHTVLPAFKEIILQCVQEDKEARPTTEELITKLLQVAVDVSKSVDRKFPPSDEVIDVGLLVLDPISRTLMRDPVLIASGKTYERSVIEDWFRLGNEADPMTGLVVDPSVVVPNVVVKSFCDDWRRDGKTVKEVPVPSWSPRETAIRVHWN